MRTGLPPLAGEYGVALREYLEEGGEADLLRAYQVGRHALAEGWGVLEMAALHQEALLAVLLKMLAPADSARIAARASEFFAESLAPFEMTRRGFQEANAILREINQQLEERVQAVLAAYTTARTELDEQKRVEHLKNEFISIVSHELRTPLTSIHGALGLVSTGLGGDVPPRLRQLLDVAYRNSRRLARLVDDILDLQKIESGLVPFRIRPVELRPLLEQAVEAHQAYAGGLGVVIVLGETPPDAWVQSDPERVMQVLANLLSNAAKFSPSSEAVRVSAERRSGMVRVAVADRGPGIPDEFQPRVFERFAQADSSTTRERGGTGLGLSISKAIVERLGGGIGFETRVGAGTTFHFDLREDVGASGRGSPP